MAYIDGFVRGEPAHIPDNFVRLWPDIYSAESPHGDESEEQSPDGEKDSAARKGRKSKEG